MTPLEKAARALVAKWRAIYEEDAPDYYAGQYSRADECADDLEAALDAAPTPHAPDDVKWRCSKCGKVGWTHTARGSPPRRSLPRGARSEDE
jgi:uncharacterized protein with PIN domain